MQNDYAYQSASVSTSKRNKPAQEPPTDYFVPCITHYPGPSRDPKSRIVDLTEIGGTPKYTYSLTIFLVVYQVCLFIKVYYIIVNVLI